MDICDRGLENICQGIIVQATADFRAAFLGYDVDNMPAESQQKQLIAFFTSEYYRSMSSVDGEYLMKRLKIDELEKILVAYERLLSEKNTMIKVVCPKSKKEGKDRLEIPIPPILFGPYKEIVEDQVVRIENMIRELRGVDVNE